MTCSFPGRLSHSLPGPSRTSSQGYNFSTQSAQTPPDSICSHREDATSHWSQTTVTYQGWLERSLFKTSPTVSAHTLSSFLPIPIPHGTATWNIFHSNADFFCIWAESFPEVDTMFYESGIPAPTSSCSPGSRSEKTPP